MRKFLLIILIILIIGVIGSSAFYMYSISPVDSNSKANIEVVIPSGMSTRNIAKLLKNKKLIRNEKMFLLYLKLNKKGDFKASTYKLKKSMNTKKIVSILTKGNNYNPDAVRLTFKEGETIEKYIKEIEEKTNNKHDDIIKVFTDREYTKTLVDTYWFLTDDILNEKIYYPLEGYLYPETLEFANKDVSVEEIIKAYLDQTTKEWESVKDDLKNGNRTIHEYITLASITQLEGRNEKDRKLIIGVFENRLKKGMNIGSDVTTYYGLKKDMTSDLTIDEINTVNAYNTRTNNMIGKLPVGPICNPELESIEAALHPTTSDYLFFVADKNGKVYYTLTNAEHTAKVKELKDSGLWIW